MRDNDLFTKSVTVENEDQSVSRNLSENKVAIACEKFIIKLMDVDIYKKSSVDELFDEARAYISAYHRMLYSTISKKVGELSVEKQYELLGACEFFLHEAKSRDSNSDKYLFFLRLYDHVTLATKQHLHSSDLEETIRQTKMIIKETKQEQANLSITLKKETERIENSLKDTQKDYITILGIFASIVLTFTGGMAFSTSVLENMHKSSIFEVILIAVILMQGSIHLVYVLMDFIYNIHNRKGLKYPKWLICLDVVSMLTLFATTSFFLMSITEDTSNVILDVAEKATAFSQIFMIIFAVAFMLLAQLVICKLLFKKLTEDM